MTTTMMLTTMRASTPRPNASTWIVSPSHTRYALPLPVPSSASGRAATSLFPLNRKVSRILKVAIGAILGSLGLVAAWWALDLAMWTAVKEWRDDCREQKQMTKTTSEQCKDILSKELSPPPTWRSFLQKIPSPLKPRSSRLIDPNVGCPHCFDAGLDLHGVLGKPPQDHARNEASWNQHGFFRDACLHHLPGKKRDDGAYPGDPRVHDSWTREISELPRLSQYTIYNGSNRITPASRSPRRSFLEGMIDNIIHPVECDMICNEGARKQGNSDIMYGGIEIDCQSDRMDGSFHASERMTVRSKGRDVKSPKPMTKQSDSEILPFGTESSNTSTRMNRYLCDQRCQIVGIHRSRIHPIRRPYSWIEATEEDNVGALKLYENGVLEETQPFVLSEEGPWDWSVWAKGLAIDYADKISVSYTGEGSVEHLDVQVLTPNPDVWRRGCACEPPVQHTTIGLGGWSVFDGPSWVLWEMLSTWIAVLMLFAYWDFMSGGRGRRKREDDERRKQKQKRTEKFKKS